MASSVNASNTGFGGILMTGDSSGELQLQTAGTTAVTINTSQNVGIGTTSPSAKFHVANAGVSAQATFVGTTLSPYITVVGNSGTTILGNESNGGWVGTVGSQAFVFKTTDTERMRIDTSGRVTMPNQPAFFARKTNGSALAPVNPVLFNDVITNIGSYYDASTGRFTAPVAGTYYFISTAHCETTNNLDRKITIYVNGSLRAEAYVLNATGARVRIVNAAILVLAVNDYVTVGTSGASDFWAGDSTGINFTGHLIG
jgi:hypothetical protein